MTSPKPLSNPTLLLGLAALVAISSLLGSLYFSQIADFTPCELCWLQRICMYPLVTILPTALLSNDKRTFLRYVTPLVAIGWLIALYHNIIYYAAMYQRLHPGGLVTACAVSGPNSCTTVYIDWFGFITIPLLSILAFTAIGILLGLYYKATREA